MNSVNEVMGLSIEHLIVRGTKSASTLTVECQSWGLFRVFFPGLFTPALKVDRAC